MYFFEYITKLLVVLFLPIKFKKLIKKKLNNKKYTGTHKEKTIAINLIEIISKSLNKNKNINYIILSSNYSNNLKNEWKNPDQFIKFLKSSFPKITFFFPTNPLIGLYSRKNYLKKPIFKNYFFNKNSNRISTGLLGSAAINFPNSVRSSIPINNLTAIGPQSMIFKKYEDLNKIKYAMDENTWWFKLRTNTLWLGIDVDVTNSFTPIHILEDQFKFNTNFTKDNWYFEGNFTIDKKIFFNINIRKPMTSISYLSYSFFNYLKKYKLIDQSTIGDLKINIINIDETLNFLDNKCYSPFKFVTFTKLIIK